MRDRSNDQNSTSLPGGLQGIDHPNTAFILIREDTAIAVDKESGKIVGAYAEGTLGIVIHGGDEKDREGNRFKTARAVRIPRLLQSDILLNFHVAEITYHESRQAVRFDGATFLLGASGFYRLEHANPFTIIPGTSKDNPCFIGFYLSPLSHYELCLVSKTAVWPERFSKYLLEIKQTPEKLFENISNRVESKESRIFSKLLFLPDRRGQKDDSSDNQSALKVLDRKNLDADREKRDIGGWWFNIPVAIYPWMTANLERLLAAYLDEGETAIGFQRAASLRSWKLTEWFHLLRHLAQGLKALHNAGSIHGDPRPANIMAQIQAPTEIEPENFRWIDIGLGYGAKDVMLETPPLDEQTTLTPRPLGGGRSTVFYAPERGEAQEFEDADIISLDKYDNAGDLSKLTFYWRKETHTQDVVVLPLKDQDETPLRELGELKKGDRIQVREFLFEVEEVMSDYIKVSGIYEIFLDRVLVEKRKKQRDRVRDRLSNASISRYRIFKQWSQATDVYGLGMIALYLFFNRGLDIFRRSPSSAGSSEKTGRNKTALYDRADREKIFYELALLLRNRSFLENVLTALKSNHIEDANTSREDRANPADAAKNISLVILASDTNFELIRFGVNGNNELFTKIIYFCLCCVWRQDEITEIAERTNYEFKPFSKSRIMLETEEQVDASQRAYEMLEVLIHLAGVADSITPPEITGLNGATPGVAREQQLITLRRDLKEAREKLENIRKLARVSVESIHRLAEVLADKIQRRRALYGRAKTKVEDDIRQISAVAKTAADQCK